MKNIMLLSVVFLLALVGCKKGEKGDRGPIGQSNIEIFPGSVTSNDFIVTNSLFGQADSVSVYLSDGTNVLGMPAFLPAQGVNTFYAWRPASHQIEIFNAQLAAATTYIIAIELQ